MKRSNHAMSWNVWDILTTLFPAVLQYILTKQHGIRGGKYLLKIPGNANSETLASSRLPFIISLLLKTVLTALHHVDTIRNQKVIPVWNSCWWEFSHVNTPLDNNDLNQVGVQQFSENKSLCGYSVLRAHNPGLGHCYERIFDLLCNLRENHARNHVTIIIAFKTCLLYGALPSFLPGHAFGHTPGVT